MGACTCTSNKCSHKGRCGRQINQHDGNKCGACRSNTSGSGDGRTSLGNKDGMGGIGGV